MSDGVELHWPGKVDAQGRRCPVPRSGAQLRRRARYRADGEAPTGTDDGPPDRLIEGDNLLSLDALAREEAGTVDLIYIDPPFATGGRFEVATPVGPKAEGARALRQPAYTDAWPGGTGGLLAMLDPRLRLMHELLAPHGSLYVHVDPTVGHAVKLLLDEVFGPGCFQREIVWRIGWVSGFKTRARNWIRNHDLLFFYVKDPSRFTFNKHYMPHPPGYLRRDGSPPKGRGVPIDDVWNAGDAELALRGRDSLDSIQIKSFSTEKTGYATQKNESLLRRIIEASSNPGDRVLDAFCGSGTTVAVAQALGRRFIGCDTGRAAIQIATGRLLARPRTRDFEVHSVAQDERRAFGARVEAAGDTEAAIVARRWSAVVGDDAGPLSVRTEVEGVPPKGPLAAWRWSVEIAVVPEADDAVRVGEDVARRRGGSRRLAPQLVLQRGLLDPRLDAWPELGFAERGRVGLRLHGLRSGELVIELLSLVYPSPWLLPEALREAALGPLELVERWAIGWQADGETFDVVLGRFDRARTLPDRNPSPHPLSGTTARVLVQVHDALHREHRIVCTLARGRRGWTVSQALALAGT